MVNDAANADTLSKHISSSVVAEDDVNNPNDLAVSTDKETANDAVNADAKSAPVDPKRDVCVIACN